MEDYTRKGVFNRSKLTTKPPKSRLKDKGAKVIKKQDVSIAWHANDETENYRTIDQIISSQLDEVIKLLKQISKTREDK